VGRVFQLVSTYENRKKGEVERVEEEEEEEEEIEEEEEGEERGGNSKKRSKSAIDAAAFKAAMRCVHFKTTHAPSMSRQRRQAKQEDALKRRRGQGQGQGVDSGEQEQEQEKEKEKEEEEEEEEEPQNYKYCAWREVQNMMAALPEMNKHSIELSFEYYTAVSSYIEIDDCNSSSSSDEMGDTCTDADVCVQKMSISHHRKLQDSVGQYLAGAIGA